MSKFYYSVISENKNEDLICFLRDKYNLNIKVISSSIINVENTSNNNWVDEIKLVHDKGFKILEIKKVGGDELIFDHDFELINPKELEENSINNTNNVCSNDILDIDKIGFIILDSMAPVKTRLRESDPFLFMTSKEYLANFTFFFLTILLIFNSIDSYIIW